MDRPNRQGQGYTQPVRPSRPKVAILRRHQILDLISGRPGDRYEAVRPFIAIDGIDESERALRDLINSVEKQWAFADARTGENLQAIENIWRQVGSPAPSMFAWAEAEAKRDTAQIDQAITTIRNYITRRDELGTRMLDWEQAGTRLEIAKVALAQAEETLNRELQNAVTGGQELTQLLQAARHFFQHHGQPEACPLCGSKEFADGLPKAVEGKLNALASIQTALNQRIAARKALDQAVALVQTAWKQLISAADALCSVCASHWPADLSPRSAITQIISERTALGAGSDWPRELVKKLSAEATKLGIALEPELNVRLQRRSLLQTLRDALDQYRHNHQQKGELEALLPR